MRIGILGGGRWGTALAVALSRKGFNITIFDINEDVVGRINLGNHPYVEGIALSENVRATSDIGDVEDSDLIICALPSHTVRDTFSKIKLSGRRVVSASKGLEIDTLKRITQIIEETQGGEVKVFALSGPSFAEEVSRGLPTAVVLGYRREDLPEALELQKIFNSENFRVYLNEDIVGVELGGALKNVIAIACGISDGLALGHNARSALITRGLVEMTRVGVLLGARKETFFGLSGMGDLVLTATSDLSRNRRFGLLIGRGLSAENALREIGQVVEGFKTVQALKKIVDEEGVYAPITNAVYRVVVENHNIHEVVKDLLLSLPGSEFDL